MRNLKHYSDDAFEFHLDVIERKYTTRDDLTYKARVSVHDEAIKRQYQIYDEHFERNSLELIERIAFPDNDKEDLLGLYSYRSKRLQELKVKLTTTESGRIINTCQNCTISEIASFDHIVPKDEFTEFIVNPKNLFPSCSKCNSYKNIAWRENGKRTFLNLYLDRLPQEQYLFVRSVISGNIVKPTFYLDNPNNIEAGLFQIIANHYNKLHLLDRFSENCDEVITNLINSIEAYIGSMSNEKIIGTSIQISEKNKIAFGHNFWKSILEIELLQNKEFLAKFLFKPV